MITNTQAARAENPDAGRKVELPSVAEIQTWAALMRDAVVVLGVPVAGGFIAKLYSWQREVTKAHIESLGAQTKALEAQNKTLEGQLAASRELQFDRQAALLKAQQEIFERERTVMLAQAEDELKAQQEMFERERMATLAREEDERKAQQEFFARERAATIDLLEPLSVRVKEIEQRVTALRQLRERPPVGTGEDL